MSEPTEAEDCVGTQTCHDLGENKFPVGYRQLLSVGYTSVDSVTALQLALKRSAKTFLAFQML